MKLGSLFDGISGFPLAASWCGIETKWISEIDPYCLKVSKKNFPNAKQYGDIKEIGEGRKFGPAGYVDIISGGFPCQPFSVAGKKEGTGDDRYLWPEMLRVIREVRPRWVIGENVPGIINLALDEVLASLEDEGYQTETFIIPACSLEAWHKRERVWICAYSGRNTSRPQEEPKRSSVYTSGLREALSNTESFGSQEGNQQHRISQKEVRQGSSFKCSSSGEQQWEFEPGVGRVANGVSRRMDRIKGLGNAIVPQLAYEIFKAIIEVEKGLAIDSTKVKE
jgi:DNA (cytosine-5)-methyltransferase 1